jgi:superfamily II DNA/RNA helicase
MELREEKSYVQSKKKWGEFEIHPEIVDLLRQTNKTKPTRIQQETLSITTSTNQLMKTLTARSIA